MIQVVIGIKCMRQGQNSPNKPRIKAWVWFVMFTPLAALIISDTVTDLTTRAPLFSSQIPDASGFTALRMIPKEATPNTVVIWAPENCPREAGQRATQLVTALAAAKIPYLRTNQLTYGTSLGLGLVAFFVVGDMFKDMEQPIVIIDRSYQANPAAETVIARYRSHTREQATINGMPTPRD